MINVRGRRRRGPPQPTLGPQLPKATATGNVVSTQRAKVIRPPRPKPAGRPKAVSGRQINAVTQQLLQRNASGRLFNRARNASSREELQAVVNDANRILRLRGTNRITMPSFSKSKFGSTRQNRELTRPFGSHKWTGDSAKGITLGIGRYFAPGIGMAQGMGETALFAGDTAAEGIFSGVGGFLRRAREARAQERKLTPLERIQWRRQGRGIVQL